MADFANAADWDPSVTVAQRVGDGPVGHGAVFDLVARFGGRDVPLSYAIVEYEPPGRVVFEARRPDFVSRDTITVEPPEAGSELTTTRRLDFQGLRRLLDPAMQLLFRRVGARARAGMLRALNP